MSKTPEYEDRLYRDHALVQFYDAENGFAADHALCVKLAEDARSVLDLGCGTGELATRVADGRLVVGVDPAAAMLDVARQRPGGGKVEWIEAPAQTFRSRQRFELIVLTGHAFQVFLTDEDQRAVLATIAMHLAPRGRFIFDTRNPDVKEWLEWTRDASLRQFAHAGLGTVTAWNEAAHDGETGIVTYDTFYQDAASGKSWSARALIRFTPKKELAAMIGDAGLEVDIWYGDWTGAPCTPASPQFIALGRLKP